MSLHVFVSAQAKGVSVAKIVGDVEVDVPETVSKTPLYIRVRYRGLWRANLALRLLFLACWLARRLGVAVHVTTNEWARVKPRG